MTRNKRTAFAIVVLAIVVAAGVAWLRIGGNAIDMSGNWKSWRSQMHIERATGGYAIDIDNPDGFLGGRYVGTPSGNVVKVQGPLSALCGRMAYSPEDDKLEFCGEQFERSDH